MKFPRRSIQLPENLQEATIHYNFKATVLAWLRSSSLMSNSWFTTVFSESLLPGELLPNVTLCSWLFWLKHKTLHSSNCTYFSANPVLFVKVILNSCPVFQSAWGQQALVSFANIILSIHHLTVLKAHVLPVYATHGRHPFSEFVRTLS